ncbi:MAG: PIN domain-containing protein [Caldilineaceae bacterium]|nr:type II toxin-antitoxin system VapC family toxin [Caldilineaceae bacterium]
MFVDTSGLLALMDGDEPRHELASAAWMQWIVDGFPLWTTNYVILESTALLQNRIGMEAVQNFHRNLVPLLHVKWIDPQLHADALAIYLATNQRRLSLVDCSSFTAMRLLKIDTVFAFDGHFSEQGFRTIPAWEQTGQ